VAGCLRQALSLLLLNGAVALQLLWKAHEAMASALQLLQAAEEAAAASPGEA
jgi:hypothetical protein